jgi:hypothetical protein
LANEKQSLEHSEEIITHNPGGRPGVSPVGDISLAIGIVFVLVVAVAVTAYLFKKKKAINSKQL